VVQSNSSFDLNGTKKGGGIGRLKRACVRCTSVVVVEVSIA
jgi:ribosomal protein S27AE